MASIGILLIFNDLPIRPNKFINWISKSVFAIYIIHQSPFIAKTIFKPDIQHIYESSNGLSCILTILAYLSIFYLAGILIDQIRIFIWEHICMVYKSKIAKSYPT